MPAPTMPPMPIDTAAAMPIWPDPVAGGGADGLSSMTGFSRGLWGPASLARHLADVSEMISSVVPWMT